MAEEEKTKESATTIEINSTNKFFIFSLLTKEMEFFVWLRLPPEQNKEQGKRPKPPNKVLQVIFFF